MEKRSKRLPRHAYTFILIAVFVMAGTLVRPFKGELPYHAFCMDMNALKERVLGSRLMQKEDMVVARAMEETLLTPHYRDHEEDLHARVIAADNFRQELSSRGVGFLYVAAPGKATLFTVPPNAENFSYDNYSRFIRLFREQGTPLLDCEEVIRNDFPSVRDAYYVSDHHWKAECAFAVAGAISRRLNELCGLPFDGSVADISNYNLEVRKNFFLGSLGKQTGAFFVKDSPDDFTLITPSFETDCSCEFVLQEELYEGDFSDAFLFPDRMDGSKYDTDPYSVYSGGNYRLQIMRNNLNPGGSKILLIRDSFAGAVQPFLALQTSELHIVDLRDEWYIEGEAPDLLPYIEQENIDCVIILYSNTGPSHGFDF